MLLYVIGFWSKTILIICSIILLTFLAIVITRYGVDSLQDWVLELVDHSIAGFFKDLFWINTTGQFHQGPAKFVLFNTFDPLFIGFAWRLFHLVPECFKVSAKQAEAIGLAIQPHAVSSFIVLDFTSTFTHVFEPGIVIGLAFEMFIG